MERAYPVQPSAGGWEIPILRATDFSPDFDQLDLKALTKDEELG